jgi:hypothetical protein
MTGTLKPKFVLEGLSYTGGILGLVSQNKLLRQKEEILSAK